MAAKFSEAGYTVIVAGDKAHGEVAGIAGFAAGCTIVESPEDAGELVRGKFCPQKAALIAQTTLNRDEFDAITDILRLAIADFRICDTLCPAVIERQKTLTELCSRVDGVLVIGGKNSANTRRLLSTAQKLCLHAVLIETPDEIPERFFSLARVGIAAGASTPDEIIDEVERRINSRS
jgi:4-hydroxy-3-methylbut-2-enyl diphosphate reductase